MKMVSRITAIGLAGVAICYLGLSGYVWYHDNKRSKQADVQASAVSENNKVLIMLISIDDLLKDIISTIETNEISFALLKPDGETVFKTENIENVGDGCSFIKSSTVNLKYAFKFDQSSMLVNTKYFTTAFIAFLIFVFISNFSFIDVNIILLILLEIKLRYLFSQF